MLRQRRAQLVAVLVGQRRVAQLAQRGRRERRAGALRRAAITAVVVAQAALVGVAVALDQALALRDLDRELRD